MPFDFSANVQFFRAVISNEAQMRIENQRS